jgi:predicted permease
LSPEVRIALLVALFVAGLVARRRGWLGPPQAGRMLRLVISVGLPALFIADVSRIPLKRDLLALPSGALVIMLAGLAASLLAGRAMRLSRPEQGSMSLCAMSINNGFLFPFVIALWGQPAFAQLALFDFGHVIGQSTFVYALAAWYGGHDAGFRAIVGRTLSFPPLWALLLALLLNTTGGITAVPEWLIDLLRLVGQVVLLLVIVALGVLFDARLLRDARVMVALALRVLLGGALGLLLAWAFGLEGLTRAVLVLGAAAPIGFNAVVFADREHLHRELAASAASISVLLGLVYVPLALWLAPVGAG